MGVKSVCFVGNYAAFSGALEVFRNLARVLKSRGVSCRYVYHKRREGEAYPSMEMFDAVDYVSDDCEREDLGAAIAAIANTCDVCHHSLIPQHWRFVLKNALRVPQVETYHSPDGWANCWRRYRMRIGCGVEKPADATVAVSRGLASRIYADSGIVARTIYNGVVVPPSGGQTRRDYVTYCGRIAHDKGLGDWMKVAVRVRDRLPWARFQWVGSLSPQYDAEAFRQMQAAYPWLEVTGFQRDPTPFYRKSACLLLTSPSEGLPMCILEAAAVGVPSLAYNTGDVAETGCHLVGGVEDAANAVVDALSGRINHAPFPPEFRAETMADSYAKVYECISRPSLSVTV